MAPDKKYKSSFQPPTEIELNRQKTIMNKYMPVSYYEHHKLFSDKDVLRMMEEYRQRIETDREFNKIKAVQLNSNPDEQNYPEVTC